MLSLRQIEIDRQFWPVRLRFFGFYFFDSQETVGFWVSGEQANWVFKVCKFILWQLKRHLLRTVQFCLYLFESCIILDRLSDVTHKNLFIKINNTYFNRIFGPVLSSFLFSCAYNVWVRITMFKLYLDSWKVFKVIVIASNDHLVIFDAGYQRLHSLKYCFSNSRFPKCLLIIQIFFATNCELYFSNWFWNDFWLFSLK